MKRVLALIRPHRSSVVAFAYKGVLDTVLKRKVGVTKKGAYYKNCDLRPKSEVSVFLFPLTFVEICTRGFADIGMPELMTLLRDVQAVALSHFSAPDRCSAAPRTSRREIRQAKMRSSPSDY